MGPYRGEMNSYAFDRLIDEYHERLPGLGRAQLNDAGVASSVIDRHRIGWDGQHFIVPIVGTRGHVTCFERWCPEELGVPADPPIVLLWNRATLEDQGEEPVVWVEGILEALIAESAGLRALAATGDGRAFNRREWAPLLKGVPVVVAMPKGDLASRRKYVPSRHRIREILKLHVPQSEIVEWPENYQRHDGVSRFFVREGRSREDFFNLPRA